MKILFVCPVLDIRYEWLLGFIQIQEQLKKHEVTHYIAYRNPTVIVDNVMGKRLLEGDYDYALRMDDDIWDVPANAVEELIKADKDFISCVMYANDFPYHRCAGVKKNKADSLVDIGNNDTGGLSEVTGTGVVPVDFTAFPFTLIKPEVFRKIPQPWFEWGNVVGTKGTGILNDNYFCQKMLDNGIQPYVHMDLQVTHRGVTHWNRTHRFLADVEFGIATGQIDSKHREFNRYISIRREVAQRYSEHKIIV